MSRSVDAPLHRWRWHRVGIAGVFIGLAALRLIYVQVPHTLEAGAYDFGVRYLIPRPDPPADIAVVEIDDRTLADLGERWPLRRATWARFVRRLAALKPAVIAIDAVFDQPGGIIDESMEDVIDSTLARAGVSEAVRDKLRDELARRDGDRLLQSAIADAGNVVLGSIVTSSTGDRIADEPRRWVARIGEHKRALPVSGDHLIASLPALAMSAKTSATLNVKLDRDGVVRRYPYAVGLDSYPVESLALAAVSIAYPDRADEFRRRILTLDRATPLLRFPRPSPVARVRFSDVLLAPENSPGLQNAMKGKIVFVGHTAAGEHEQVAVPLGVAIPGVQIHAAAAANLLANTHARSGGVASYVGLALALLLLGSLVVAYERTERIGLVVALSAVVVIAHFAAAYVLLAARGLQIGLVPVTAGVGALITAEGILRFRRLQGKRRELAEQERLTRVKSDFISVVSHELRTPLTSIRGALGLLHVGAAGELPDKPRELVGVAHSNTERLIRLVNDVLDLQKMEAGRMELRLASCDICRLVHDTLAANAAFAEQYEVELDADSLDPACVTADADRIVQVLTNLLSNAIKFAPRGSAVCVRVVATEARVRVEVTDKGPGIPVAFRSQVFAAFSQAGTNDAKSGGTGLGLSIARSIVEAHRGEIGFESELGAGTTFFFVLPAAASSSSNDSCPDEEPTTP